MREPSHAGTTYGASGDAHGAFVARCTDISLPCGNGHIAHQVTLMAFVDSLHFNSYANGSVQQRIEEVEQLYAARFTQGNVRYAIATLLAKQGAAFSWHALDFVRQ